MNWQNRFPFFIQALLLHLVLVAFSTPIFATNCEDILFPSSSLLLKRISETEMKTLVRKIALLEKADFKSLSLEDRLVYKLGQYLQKQVSENELVTDILRWEIVSDAHTYSLAANPHVQVEALLSENTLEPTSFFELIFGDLSSIQKKEALESLKKFPSSERTLGMVQVYPLISKILLNPDGFLQTHEKLPQYNWLHFSSAERGYNINRLIYKSLSKNNCLLIPSFSVLKLWLSIIYGKHAVLPIPEIGKTNSIEIFESIEQGGRTLGLTFPGFDHGDLVEGHLGKFMISIHDLEHIDMVADKLHTSFRKVLGHFMLLLKPFLSTDTSIATAWWNKHNAEYKVEWLGSHYQMIPFSSSYGFSRAMDLRFNFSEKLDSSLNRDDLSLKIAKGMLDHSWLIARGRDISIEEKEKALESHFLTKDKIATPIVFLIKDVITNPKYYTDLGLNPEIMLKEWGMSSLFKKE